MGTIMGIIRRIINTIFGKSKPKVVPIDEEEIKREADILIERIHRVVLKGTTRVLQFSRGDRILINDEARAIYLDRINADGREYGYVGVWEPKQSSYEDPRIKFTVSKPTLPGAA